MPTKDGKLSLGELQIIVEKFRHWEVEKLGGDLICEVCKGDYWVPHPFLLGRDSYTVHGATNSYRMPSIAFSCSQCGNTKSFFAPLMGIIPEGGEPIEDLEETESTNSEGDSNGS